MIGTFTYPFPSSLALIFASTNILIWIDNILDLAELGYWSGYTGSLPPYTTVAPPANSCPHQPLLISPSSPLRHLPSSLISIISTNVISLSTYPRPPMTQTHPSLQSLPSPVCGGFKVEWRLKSEGEVGGRWLMM